MRKRRIVILMNMISNIHVIAPSHMYDKNEKDEDVEEDDRDHTLAACTGRPNSGQPFIGKVEITFLRGNLLFVLAA